MELDILIPKKTDVAGNISVTNLQLTLHKETVNPENNLRSYWIKGEFKTLEEIESYSSKMVSKAPLLTKSILTFPEYYQASIILPDNMTVVEFKDIKGNDYVVVKKHLDRLVLTIKQPTLEDLFEKLSLLKNII